MDVRDRELADDQAVDPFRQSSREGQHAGSDRALLVSAWLRRLWEWWDFERLVFVLLTLNLADAVSTHILLSIFGAAIELNPLLRWAYTVGPAEFWIVKIAIISAGLAMLGKMTSERIATRTARAAVFLYTVVLITHLKNWLEYLIR